MARGERTEQLGIRVTPDERRLLELVAEASSTSVSSVVRAFALPAARRRLAEAQASVEPAAP